MAKLNLKAIEERVAPLGGREAYDRELIFDLLLAYGKPQSSITRLRNGDLNVAADKDTEVAQKKVVYFKETSGDTLEELEELKKSPDVVRFSARFVIVTDYVELVATDTQTGETIGFPIGEIGQHFTFFLPWAGMEKAQYVAETHADVKAAERMGKLFDELLQANPDLLKQPGGRHALNLFFTRLLFCYFAEDTGIFAESQFTNAVGSHTLDDGSDTADFLTDLFTALDTADASDKPKHLAAFPYVNGRLFTMSEDHVVPVFTKKAREELINAGKLIWREINPDIFGSMFQAIVTPGKRSDLGQHYTSVPNILKTIEPLFLNTLKDELDESFDSVKKLEALLNRISAIKVFDPACGSGNFLIIAYKELRKLEHAILERLAELDDKHLVLFAESRINIENFYGIEIDDFAVEVAILSLWIAKHQMNTEFKEKFNVSIPLIPLKETGQIKQGNATHFDWNHVCPNDGGEIYLIGNPPYVGSSMQSSDQKTDFSFVFGRRPFSKNLDYIALWFVKGSDYIKGTRAQLAFVTTNSVAQGEHVSLMFPTIFNMGIEIGFAYTSFKWENNAKRNAGVTVAVISLRNESNAPKYIFTDDLQIAAKNINGYLTDAPSIIVGRQMKPISTGLPPMAFGSKPTDGGYLVLEPDEKARLLDEHPIAAQFVKRYVGAADYINDIERYCLWITDREVRAARLIPPIASRLDKLSEWRLESKAQSTVDFAGRPHRFKQIAYKPSNSIFVPRVSSERRTYIPMGYLDEGYVINDQAYAAYDAEPWVFAVLTSSMHMSWTRAVAGQMETRLRYSNTIVYNNFPVPPLPDAMKEKLTVAALRVLDVREYHCERTLAELYDPDLMPDDLRAAHAEIDALVDSIYSKRGYETDEQRLSDLFAMYEEMTKAEATKAPARKTRRTAK
ncbi:MULTISPECIES: DNA methyltransferase [Paenarthrobacter]|uniref:DNA methyltransferase n=1 Tax=Paenarthrobacter TaxID=1742992 RepID=UPI001FB4ACAB|nr:MULTISPECIES: DNA methyltransferase [Paenarthrobacter]MCW3767786.1 N-6 DNA methylase [Paenarthrobacter sp. PAE-2]UOD83404.1 N-6 DNA methylase [Paenarthrobacter ureafaciens]WNZ05108.1 N-6 DNA methylase [Paenarthrobacter ureafaciens]WOC63276.1 DNA methyltransferase [Paenarthrobacter sp. AT5]